MAVLNGQMNGTFISTGLAYPLDIPMGFDYLHVWNRSSIGTPVGSAGTEFEWVEGMASGEAFEEAYNAGATAIQKTLLTTGGIYLITQTDPAPVSALLTGTAISNANPPVASSGATGDIAEGDIVTIISATGAAQFNGYQFTVGTVVANTTFVLPYAPTIVAGTTFSYRYVKYDRMFYPASRLISEITRGATTEIQMTVTHRLTPGQLVTFKVPSVFGMTQLDGLRARILAVNTTTNTITVDIDSSAFTAFAFPLTAVAAAPYTFAQVIPFGDGLDPTTPLITSSTLAGATRNVAIRGAVLSPGVNGPGGAVGNVMYWVATKSSN